MTAVKPAKHRTCQTEITVMRTRPEILPTEAETYLWCPTCRRAVTEHELTVKGPYSVWRERNG
jgi:hypothetical protein